MAHRDDSPLAVQIDHPVGFVLILISVPAIASMKALTDGPTSVRAPLHRACVHRHIERGRKSQVGGPFSRVVRVVLAQAVAVESKPAVWDGDLERLLVAGDGGLGMCRRRYGHSPAAVGPCGPP
jgi:hypothetical protein